MSELVVDLKNANAIYGGKAEGLSKLIQGGLPVPPGIALSPDLVSELVQEGNTDSLVERISLDPGKKYAVRSSAIGEDGEQFSYAGMYDTLLNISSAPSELLDAIKTVGGSNSSNRLETYTSEHVGTEKNAKIGIVIQEMIEPEIAGVAFSSAIGVDGRNTLLIEFVSGLGDKLVSGEATPVRVEVPYSDGKANLDQAIVTGYSGNVTGLDELVTLVQKVSDLTQSNMDIEWAIDKDGVPWLLQARPVTKTVFVPSRTRERAVPAAPGIATATTFVIDSEDDLEAFPKGAILVAEVTETNYLPAMNMAAAVVTEEGGILSHAAIVCRELGIPCIVGYESARQKFPTGTDITIDGSSAKISADGLTSKADNSDNTAIDWGAAYLFENLVPITIRGVTVLFDPTPVGLCVHIPEELQADIDQEIELFARQEFGQPPKRYQTDKYLWGFEWHRYAKNSYFADNLTSAKTLITEFDADGIDSLYDRLINNGQILAEAQKEADPAVSFLVDETHLATHFILTMLIPEGYALKEMYLSASPDLREHEIPFAELLGAENTDRFPTNNLQKIATFSKIISDRRNSVYAELLDKRLARDDYFEDREERASAAISTMGLDCPEGADPVSVFYENIGTLVSPDILIQSFLDKKKERLSEEDRDNQPRP